MHVVNSPESMEKLLYKVSQTELPMSGSVIMKN